MCVGVQFNAMTIVILLLVAHATACLYLLIVHLKLSGA